MLCKNKQHASMLCQSCICFAKTNNVQACRWETRRFDSNLPQVYTLATTNLPQASTFDTSNLLQVGFKFKLLSGTQRVAQRCAKDLKHFLNLSNICATHQTLPYTVKQLHNVLYCAICNTGRCAIV